MMLAGKNRIRVVFSLIIFPMFIAACGGGSGGEEETLQTDLSQTSNLVSPGFSVYGLNGEQADQTFVPWLAVYRSFRSIRGFGSTNIATLQYSASRTVEDEIVWRSAQNVAGSCTFNGDTVESGGGSSGGSTPPYVNAGSSVVINAPSGPLLTLPRGDDLQYESDTGPGPLPAEATLSIPGAVFPSVSSYPLFEPPAPVRISPAAGARVDVDTTFTWQRANSNEYIIAVDFLEYDENGDFLGFPMFCYTEDDGEFTLPADAAVTLAALENEIQVRYSRILRRLDLIDGTLFYQRTQVAE